MEELNKALKDLQIKIKESQKISEDMLRLVKDALNPEIKCTCGDTEEQHVDGCEQCVVPECGCKEFEEANE